MILVAKLTLAAEVVYAFNIAFVKLSLLVFYYRLLQVSFQTSRPLRIAAYIIAVLVVGAAIISIFTNMLVCVPIEKIWRPDLPGHCFGATVPWIVNSIMSIVTDVAILVLPIPEICKLRLSRMEKVGVILTLSTGCG